MSLDQLSIGVAGALDTGLIAELAQQAEELGFRGLWINDTPAGDSLAGLAAAAAATSRLTLATGVIPIDRRPVSEIAHGIHELDPSRLVIGIGSGGPRDALGRVSRAVKELKDATSVPVLVGALGPRMRRLAAEEADGALLSWLTPQAAAEAMSDLRRDASGAARGVLYARTIVDADAQAALEAEASMYTATPWYAANLTRIGATALETTIGHASLAEGIRAYTDVVDELVLRAITPTGSREEYGRFLTSVASLFRK